MGHMRISPAAARGFEVKAACFKLKMPPFAPPGSRGVELLGAHRPLGAYAALQIGQIDWWAICPPVSVALLASFRSRMNTHRKSLIAFAGGTATGPNLWTGQLAKLRHS